MAQRTTLEIIAPTVEEAIAQGLAQLGLTADAVSVEVLDAGSKGFFGFGKPQVRVRLTVNPPPGSVTETESKPIQSAEPAEVRRETRPAARRAPPKPREDAPAPAVSPSTKATEQQ